MSSEVESGGVVAAAVALPVGVAFGVGWLAWQSGKLLIEANRAADRHIAEKKRQLAEAAMHRKHAALAVHSQLVDMCTQLLHKIEGDIDAASIIDFTELNQLQTELNNICHESIPDDVMQIESLNSIGYLKLDKIVAKHQYLSGLKIEKDDRNLYHGLSLADLMLDMKAAIAAAEIHATSGKDIKAANPIVLERAELNKRLSKITARTMSALDRVEELSATYGLSASDNAWFHSCFNGVDKQIEVLYLPSTTNEKLKRGIRSLESMLEQYDTLMPIIEEDQKKFAALYQVYIDASKALREPVADIRSFKSLKDLENRLLELKKRSEKAQECAEIYQKLGPEAYICFAWDQELRALGYSVHARKDIEKMAQYKPQHAQVGEGKLPFYRWSGDDLTQLYSMASECSLQVIVHDDGSVTMKAISDAKDEQTKAIQSEHCSLLGRLHENLRKNWFVMYDYQETTPPEETTSVAEWFNSAESAWSADKRELIGERQKERNSESRADQFQKRG